MSYKVGSDYSEPDGIGPSHNKLLKGFMCSDQDSVNQVDDREMKSDKDHTPKIWNQYL